MRVNIQKILVFLLSMAVFSGCTSPPDNVAPEVLDYLVDKGRYLEISPVPLSPLTDADAVVDNLILGGDSGRVDPRLPSYSYFQGLVHARKHLWIAGQVRVVGGVVGVDGANSTFSLYKGAMVTSNPDAFLGAGTALTGGPDGMRTRVASWEEIPNP